MKSQDPGEGITSLRAEYREFIQAIEGHLDLESGADTSLHSETYANLIEQLGSRLELDAGIEAVLKGDSSASGGPYKMSRIDPPSASGREIGAGNVDVRLADPANTAALRSLLNWLREDEYVRDKAQPTLRDSSSENTAAELPVIELVLTAGFRIADLALTLVEWLKGAEAAAPIVITAANGWPTRIYPDDLATASNNDYQVRRALVGAPDPRKSSCVLIGVSEYGTLRELPQVQKNLAVLRDVLLDPDIWGVPKNRIKIIDYPRSAIEIRDAIANAAQDASETLLVYFAGHGLHDQQNGLLLALPDATGEAGDHTVQWRELAEIIGNAESRRKVVWLDCCYAGLALPGNADHPDPTGLRTAARTQDTYLLAATHEEAKAPDGGECTAFTGELVHVLRNGIEPGRPTEEFLSLNSIHREVRIGLRARGLPEPSRDDPGLIGLLPHFHNNLIGAPTGVLATTKSQRPALVRINKRRAPYAVAASLVALLGLIAFVVYLLVPGPVVSGLDLAKYCSALSPGGDQSFVVAGTSCVQKINLDDACDFTYQSSGLDARFTSPDANSAQCFNSSSSSASRGGISDMTGYCAANTKVPGVTATANNALYPNEWICQVNIDTDLACAVQNNRRDVVSVKEEDGSLACLRAHLF